MTLSQVSAKIDLRLNKAASGDYDNIWSYHKEEAFNKAVTAWVRRQKHGKNVTQEGDEETDMRVDDLQPLLKTEIMAVKKKDLYSQTTKLPTDYLYFKRLTPVVTKGSCGKVSMKSHLREEANVDDLLSLPSFEFEETFHTIINNRAHIYHNNQFSIDSALLTYYRAPKKYSFKKLSTVVEFKDDVVELIVAETCKILAGDIESFNQRGLSDEGEKTDN